MQINFVRIASVATAISIVLVGCSSPADREARALRRGAEFMAAGNYEKARIEFKNALQAQPNDAEARFQNGVLLEKMGQPRDAVQFYLGATEINPKHYAARAALARLLIAGHAAKDAMDVIDVGLEQKPGDGPFLAFRAAAKMQLQDEQGALEDAESAYKAKPNDEYVVAILAGICRAKGDLGRARQVLESGVISLPGTVDLRLALASLELEAHQNAKAEYWLRKLVELRPKEPSYRVHLAQFLANSGQTEAAEKEIRETRRLFPNDSEARDGLVRFLIANRGVEAAESELRKEADQAPSDDSKRAILGAFLAETGQREKAEREFSTIVQHAGTSDVGLTAKARLAALAVDRGDLTTANKLVGEVLARSPRDADALVVRGTVRLRQGDARGAVEDLRAASRDVPNSAPVMADLARAHAASGEFGLAEEAFRKAVELGGGAAPWSAQLATFLLSQGRPAEARDVIHGVFTSSNDNPELDEITLRAALGAHDHNLAQEVIAKARNAPGGAARAAFYAGLTAVAEGHRDDALKHYLESVDKDPAAAAPVGEAVKLLTASGRRADALKLLDTVSSKVPGSPAAPLLKGDLLLVAREFTGAQAAYQEALRRQPKSAAAYRGLAYVVLGEGNVDGAVAALSDAAPKSDDPGRLLASAGQILELSKRTPAAIEKYEAAVKLIPSDESLRAHMALLILSIRDDAAAQKRAGELVSGMGDSSNARLRDAYAFVELRSGDAPGALRLLERLEIEQSGDPLINYHLGATRQQTGDREGAIKSLSKALQIGQAFIGEQDARQRLDALSSRR